VKHKITLLVSCLLVVLLASLVLRASNEGKFVFSPDLRTVRATNASSEIMLAPAVDPGLTTIAGNLSQYQYATYFSVFGNTIDQGVGGYPFLIWQGEAFTPAANATVTELQVAVGDLSGGTSGIEVGLYNDANGVPGRKIKSFHIAPLQHYGECCALATATDKAGIAVTAGTQYWLVVSTTNKDVDIYGWNFNSTDMRPHLAAYYCKGSPTYCGNNSGKWVPYQYVQNGFAVLGN
jgi:hypothetical protein